MQRVHARGSATPELGSASFVPVDGLLAHANPAAGVSADLPVREFQYEIMDAVYRSPAAIIVAETGAGKSTQVAQMLNESGYDNVVVTQPRILAARSLANRVAYERGEEVGNTVGYRTALEQCAGPDTSLLYCTDGYTLVQELLGGARRPDVLVIDEVHEWNLNIEILVAWARRELRHNPQFKVVLMSATVEEEELSRYFGSAPIVRVPGRTFPVHRVPAGESVELDAAMLLRAGHNVLVFQPGKPQIEATIEKLENMGVRAKLLPLHAELTPEEQERCFDDYGIPKCIVATDIAQTSITIPDITAVIDSGEKRELEVVDGVEGLYLTEVSLAEAEQRAGRAGRVQPGLSIDHCRTPAARRRAFPVPEIQRVQLDQAVLRLAIAGLNMEELEFFHQPPREKIHEARESLIALGCMTSDGRVTEIGRRVAGLPVSAKTGRMIVEAERLGVVDDVITIAAIMEAKGIVDREKEWQVHCLEERDSDLLAQLQLFKKAQAMTSDEEREDAGVHLRHFQRALAIREHIQERIETLVNDTSSSGDRIDIMKSITAGMVDHIYRSVGDRWVNGSGEPRELSRDSVIEAGRFVVGLPFDLELPKKERGKESKILHLVTMATCLDPGWLVEVAPQHVTVRKEGQPKFDPVEDGIVIDMSFEFKGESMRASVTKREHPQASSLLSDWLAAAILEGSEGGTAKALVGPELNGILKRNRRMLDRAPVGSELERLRDQGALAEWIMMRLGGAGRLADISTPGTLALTA